MIGVRTLLALLLVASAVHGTPRVRLTGGGDERGFDTFRCISKVTGKTGPVFIDRTGDGLRVGQLQPIAEGLPIGTVPAIEPEERIAVIRPVFSDSITAVRGFRVIEVIQRTLRAPTTAFQINDSWSAGTGTKELFEIARDATAISQGQLVALFQRVLESNNNSSSTNGIYLSGTADLRVPASQPLLYDVLLEPLLSQGTTPDSTSVHQLLAVTATAEIRNIAIGNDQFGNPVTQRLNVLAFSCTRRGKATIFVREATGTLRPIQKDLGVVGGQVYRTVIRNEALATGTNQVLVSVADTDDPDVPPDLIARGFSEPLTMVNPP